MKKGDKVKVRGTNHETEVYEIKQNGYIVLKDPLPSHRCNYYTENELEVLQPEFLILHTLATDKDGNQVDSWDIGIAEELKNKPE